MGFTSPNEDVFVREGIAARCFCNARDDAFLDLDYLLIMRKAFRLFHVFRTLCIEFFYCIGEKDAFNTFHSLFLAL